MTLPTFQAKGATHAYLPAGLPLEEGTPHIIWAHGWGQDHHAFQPLTQPLLRSAHHTLLDFPGFGQSPPPPAAWGTQDYADAIAEWLATLPKGRRIWVGHSFGGRVALRLAVRHPGLLNGFVIVGGHGLQRRRSLGQRINIFLRVRAFKALKLLEKLGVDVSKAKAKFGSADYRNAGAMRETFVKVIREDQEPDVPKIRAPVALIYGANDAEAPAEFGERMAKLIPGSTLNIVPGLDHYSILTDGGPQIVHTVSRMLEA